MLKREKRLFYRVAVFCVLLLLTGFTAYGCALPTEPTAEKPAEQKPAEKLELQRISIATGGTGGTYFPYGGAVAGIINNYVPNAEAAAEVTGASVENVRLIERGEVQIATVMNDVVYHAFNAQGAFNTAIELRTLFTMYPHFFHVVTREGSPIHGIESLKGKRVSVGAPGSGTEVMAGQVLKALGITYDQFNVFHLSFAENTEALRDNVIDAGIWSVGAPTSSIMDLATSHKIRILGFSADQLAAIKAKHPYYSAIELKAGTYQNVDEAIAAPSVWNSVVVHKDMPEELAYQIVKAVFENQDELVKVYIGAEDSTPENTILQAVVPLHPGVVRYLREIGLQLDDRLIPPEMK